MVAVTPLMYTLQMKLDPLQEQFMFITTEPSFQPRDLFYYFILLFKSTCLSYFSFLSDVSFTYRVEDL